MGIAIRMDTLELLVSRNSYQLAACCWLPSPYMGCKKSCHSAVVEWPRISSMAHQARQTPCEQGKPNHRLAEQSADTWCFCVHHCCDTY